MLVFIVIIRPDKDNGVVIMDTILHRSKMYELLNDERKFKQLCSDPTKLCEGQLQRCLWKLSNKGYLDNSVYDLFTQRVHFPQDYVLQPKFIRLRKTLIYHLLDLLCRQLIVITVILQVIYVNY